MPVEDNDDGIIHKLMILVFLFYQPIESSTVKEQD